MILLNYKDKLFKYFIYISIVFVTLFVITTFINLDSNKNNTEGENAQKRIIITENVY